MMSEINWKPRECHNQKTKEQHFREQGMFNYENTTEESKKMKMENRLFERGEIN